MQSGPVQPGHVSSVLDLSKHRLAESCDTNHMIVHTGATSSHLSWKQEGRKRGKKKMVNLGREAGNLEVTWGQLPTARRPAHCLAASSRSLCEQLPTARRPAHCLAASSMSLASWIGGRACDGRGSFGAAPRGHRCTSERGCISCLGASLPQQGRG